MFGGTPKARFSDTLSGGFRIEVDEPMSIIHHRWRCHPGKPNVTPEDPEAVGNAEDSAAEGVVTRTAEVVEEATSSREVINSMEAISSNKVVITKGEEEEDTVKETRAV